jgi:predicted RNA-binding Zn-ribbon protein involved in translation (DUF1610 family)
MREIVLKKEKYIQIPEHLENIVKNSQTVEKLSLHHCYNGKLNFHAKHWPNLKFLEIIDCSYLELAFYFSEDSALSHIYISNSDSLNIGEFLGYYPSLTAWRIDDSRFIKFKGQIKGNIALESLEFNHVLRSEIFQSPVELNNLKQIAIRNRSNFFKINLSQLKAPKLKILWFQDSNYLNFQSLGKIGSQLESFKFVNCKYPKLNIDFKQLTAVTDQAASLEGTLQEGEELSQSFKSSFNPKHFRESKKKRRRGKLFEKNPFRDPNAPDIQLIRNSPDPTKITKKAQKFLQNTSFNSLTSQKKDQKFKYCPECGQKNPYRADFCSECGEKFR